MRPCRRTADEPNELAPLHAFPQRTRLVQGIITTTSRPAVVREMAPSRSPNRVGLMSQLGQTRKFRHPNGKSVLHSGADLTGLLCRSGLCRYCCKSRKSDDAKNLAKVDV